MTKQISLLKKIGIGAVVGLASLVSGAEPATQPTTQPASQPAAVKQEIKTEESSWLIRTRAENTHKTDASGNGSNYFTSTLALTPMSGPLASPNPDQFYETFRVYDVRNKVNGKNLSSQLASVSTPYMKFNDKSNDGWFSQIFGATGDCSEGFGNQTKIVTNGFTITGNAEQRTSPDNATRFGIGVDYDFKIGDSTLTTGAGFDQVNTSAGTSRYYVGKATLDTKLLPMEGRDRFGVSMRLADEVDSKTTTFAATQGHYGAKSPVGWRLFERVDSCSEKDATSFSTSGIFAQNPYYLGMNPPYPWNGSFQWMEGDRCNAGIFDVPVVTNALNTERYSLNYRSREGVVAAYSFNTAKSGGSRSTSLELDVGYTFPEFKIGNAKIKPGFYVFDKNVSTNAGKGSNTLGVSGIVDVELGKNCFLTGEISGSKSSAGPSEVYTSLGISWRW